MASARETGVLTVAAIRKVRGETQYLFNQKQAIFKLTASGKAGRESGELLKEALRKKAPVKAEINTKERVIHRIAAPSERELDGFEKLHILLEKPDKSLRVDISSLDPTVFNLE